MFQTIRPQLRTLPALVSVAARRQATTHTAPLTVTRVKAERSWRDTLNVAPLAAAFAHATTRAFDTGAGELVQVRFQRGRKELRTQFDDLMAHISDAAKQDLDLEISWESAAADPNATERHAIIAPKR